MGDEIERSYSAATWQLPCGYLTETTNWRALTGFGDCGGGPAMSQMAIPVNAAARKVGIAIVLRRGIWQDCLQVPDVQEAGPAIFAIDEAKNECHGINSVVDRVAKTAALVLRADFVGREIDVVGLENGFRQIASGTPLPGPVIRQSMKK
jgi:hypothetical protein